MTKLFVGGDVSKGYADFEIVGESGDSQFVGRFDDTAEGHESLKKELVNLLRRTPDAEFVAGMESTGGLELNWLKFFRGLKKEFKIVAMPLNAYAVKRFLEHQLHRNVNDRVSARGIADYLRAVKGLEEPRHDPDLEGKVHLYRCVQSATDRIVELENELQSMLPFVQPELVQFSRDGLPQWLLHLLIKFPTTKDLGAASYEDLCTILFIKKNRIGGIIESAKRSVAARDDKYTGLAVRSVAEELLGLQKKVEVLKKALCEEMKNDEGVKIMDSIPSIGTWGAVTLRLEIGSVEWFYSAESLTAFSGLDDRTYVSGDGKTKKGISKRGRSGIRKTLYMQVLNAIQHNPVIKDFYDHLISRGKAKMVAIVACMRKMLHIIYGCWISGKTFDAHYEYRMKERKKQNSASTQKPEKRREQMISLSAPISRREAKRRKAATSPQASVRSKNVVTAPPSQKDYLPAKK